MSKALLIFDLDGTLIDSVGDLSTAVNMVRRHYGLPPLPRETIGGYIGDGIRMLIKRSMAGSDAVIDDAVRLQRQFYSEHMHDETVLYPGVEKGLRELHRRGYSLAVASNKQADLCDRILAHFNIRDLFIHVAGDGNSPFLKPRPEVLWEIMKLAGAPAEQTWVVGDSYPDLEAARRAGVRSVFLTCGIGRQGSETPTRTCSSFDELLEMFPG